MELDDNSGDARPEPKVLAASTMLTPSYQDYLLGRALPAKEHATELLNVLFDDGLTGQGMSWQEIETILSTAAGRLH
jgi:hypothetical protein